jgi:hypothetical protein
MARREIYVSVDIEADGPIPGRYSMLSLGAAAFWDDDPTPVATWEGNFARLIGADQHADTMDWWSRQDPAVWSHVNDNPVDPELQTLAFVTWLESLPGNPVLVTYPAWDQMWVTWYITAFSRRNPFGLSGLDLKTLAMATLGFPSFKSTIKRHMPEELFEGAPPHTHKALDDAIGQGVLLVSLMRRRAVTTREP